MKRKLLVNKLLIDAYTYIDSYGDTHTGLMLIKRAIQEVEKEKQTKQKETPTQ